MRRIVTVLVLALLMTACAGTREAYRAAEGLEDTAKVIGEHYYALVLEANTLAQNGQLTGSSLLAAQNVVRSTEVVVIQLAAASKAYEAVKSATTEAELEAAITAAAIAVSNMIDVLKGSSTTRLLDSVERDLDRVSWYWVVIPSPA